MRMKTVCDDRTLREVANEFLALKKAQKVRERTLSDYKKYIDKFLDQSQNTLDVGIVSGNKEPDKFAKAGFHATRSEFVDAPLINELPMALECEVISYNEETCRLVGRIVNVCADQAVLGENGKVDVAKLRPITYDSMNHHYLVLGEKVGQAFRNDLTLK